jgi:hypothetical protein
VYGLLSQVLKARAKRVTVFNKRSKRDLREYPSKERVRCESLLSIDNEKVKRIRD